MTHGAQTAMAHGTASRYTTGGCRCPLCKSAMRRYGQARRALLRSRGLCGRCQEPSSLRRTCLACRLEWQRWRQERKEANPIRELGART
jgi:transposase-like protein